MLDADGNPFFIDFQGGRKGPFYYDLASFLWQASAKYPFKLRRELVWEYYQSLKNYTEVPSVRHFVNRLSLFVLFRTLQVLGATDSVAILNARSISWKVFRLRFRTCAIC